MTKHNFKSSLEIGNLAELFVKKYYQKIFAKTLVNFANIEICDYDRKEDCFQIKGIDGFVKVQLPYEVKTRDYFYYKYQDILLEIMAETERNKLGWVYTTESKIVVYLWLSEDQQYFIDGYLLFIEKIRKWLKKNKKQFKTVSTKSKNAGYVWTTISIVIPIKDFPVNCFEPISKDIFRKKIPMLPSMADYQDYIKSEL